jgi:hypothetical protein
MFVFKKYDSILLKYLPFSIADTINDETIRSFCLNI